MLNEAHAKQKISFSFSFQSSCLEFQYKSKYGVTTKIVDSILG